MGDKVDLSPFSRMIASGEDLIITQYHEAKTPRIQSSLGLEPSSDGSWTSSIISPAGLSAELSCEHDQKNAEEKEITEGTEEISPDLSKGSSPVFKQMKRRMHTHAKRRRLNQVFSDGIPNDSRPEINAVLAIQPPVLESNSSDVHTSARHDTTCGHKEASLSFTDTSLTIQPHNVREGTGCSSLHTTLAEFHKSDDNKCMVGLDNESNKPDENVGRTARKIDADIGDPKSPAVRKEVSAPHAIVVYSPDLLQADSKKARLELARKRKRSWRTSYKKELDHVPLCVSDPAQSVIPRDKEGVTEPNEKKKEDVIISTDIREHSEQPSNDDALSARGATLQPDGNSCGSLEPKSGLARLVGKFKDPFLVEFLRKRLETTRPTRQEQSQHVPLEPKLRVSVAEAREKILRENPDKVKVSPDPRLSTLNGSTLRTTGAIAKAPGRRPFIPPWETSVSTDSPVSAKTPLRSLSCRKEDNATPPLLLSRSLGLSRALNSPGLSSRKTTPSGVATDVRGRTKSPLLKPTFSTPLQVPSGSFSNPCVGTEVCLRKPEPSHLTKSIKPLGVLQPEKAKSIFGEDFESFMTEVSRKGGGGIRKDVNTAERARNIFGSDFDKIRKENPAVLESVVGSHSPEQTDFGKKSDDLSGSNPRFRSDTGSGFHSELKLDDAPPGFKTATGNPLVISTAGLNKAKQLFGSSFDTAKESFTGALIGASDGQAGFKTGTGKLLNVSEAGLSKAKKLFGSSFETAKERFTNALIGASDGRAGFKTGTGKLLNVSEAGLNKAEQMFGSSLDSPSDSWADISKPTGAANVPSGFKTGGGKILNLSHAELNKAKQLFGSSFVTRNESCPELEISPATTGYDYGQKADQLTNISAAGLTKAKEIFESASESVCNGPESKLGGFSAAFGKPVVGTEFERTQVEPNTNEEDLERVGISAALGDTVLASIPSLRRGRAVVDGSDKRASEVPQYFAMSSAEPPAHLGFKSGSGKLLNVSAAGVERAKKLFRLGDEVTAGLLEGDAPARSVGFATASGKKVDVTKSNLNRARAFLSVSSDAPTPEEEEDLIPINQGSVSPPALPIGFRSGSGKALNVSSAGLARAKAIFGGDLDLANCELPSKQLCGFSTAKGKAVPISESSLAKSRTLFNDERTRTPARLMAELDESIGPAGFSTGSGTPIPISSKSMERVKNLFQIDMDPLPETAFTPERVASKRGLHFTPLGSRKPSTLARKSIFGKLANEVGRKAGAEGSLKVEPCGRECDDTKLTEVVDEFGDDSQDLALLEDFARYDPTSTPLDVLSKRRAARSELQNSIASKAKVKPVPGKLFAAKTSCAGRVKLRDVPLDAAATVPDRCRLMPSSEAGQFFFHGWKYFEDCKQIVQGYTLGDGCQLIPSDGNIIGLPEFIDAFHSSPGVDPKLAPKAWVANHYKWIVQKLHWMEEALKIERSQHPENVLLQLKYRYDLEVDRAERSCLRKILEQDDTASKPMVLYVANVVSTSRLELSDGWYSVWGTLDAILEKALKMGKINIGTKLNIVGSSVAGAPEPCDPLKKVGTECLHLAANSCRVAPWYSKLGYHQLKEAPSAPLRNIRKEGGSVPRVSCVVTRLYPTLYLVKRDGVSTTLNARMYESCMTTLEDEKTKQYEKVRSEVEKEVFSEPCKEPEKKRRRTIASEDDYLSSLQAKRDEVDKEVEKRLREANNEVDTIPFVRLRIVDAASPASGFSFIVTFWRPPSDFSSALKEGTRVDMFKLSPSVSSGSKPWEISLNTGRGTVLRPGKILSLEMFRSRQAYSISAMYAADFVPDFLEVDLAAYVASVGDDKSSYQIVVLSDGSDRFLILKFWKSIKHYGWDRIVKEGAVLSVSNIQWRIKASRVGDFRCAYCSESTVFTEKAPAPHLTEALSSLKATLKNETKVELSLLAQTKHSEFVEADKRWRTGPAYQTPGPYRNQATTPGSALGIKNERNLRKTTHI